MNNPSPLPDQRTLGQRDGLGAAPAVRWKDGTTRRTHVRHSAYRPPLPLGCRRCGHPPYAHQAAALPHAPHHLYEAPTIAQMRRRGEVRRRLGQCRLPLPTPPRNVRPRPLLPIEAAAAAAVRDAHRSAPAAPPGRCQPGTPMPVGRRPSRKVA
ncbi:hypothetical protein [Microtetraspora malaysiensis]|uniref:Uncharacterized protein n=1 Tax=Microtetraspora malaysiensis TaxID=161358 RepID=A0ABW6T300_9ACTN